MRSFLLGALCAVTLLNAGCGDLGVGRKCLNASGGDVQGTQISTPALECMSRLCYLQGDPMNPSQPTRSICTARCTTNDDCKNALIDGKTPGLCGSSYVCAVATTVDISGATESFACETLCICKDDLTVGANADSNKNACCPTACSSKGKCPPNLPKC